MEGGTGGAGVQGRGGVCVEDSGGACVQGSGGAGVQGSGNMCVEDIEGGSAGGRARKLGLIRVEEWLHGVWVENKVCGRG